MPVKSVREACEEADVIMILAPDTAQKAIYLEDIAPTLKKGDTLMFAHGFNIHFKAITPPDFVDVSDARILVVDDVADTGHTLRSVEKFCEGKVAEVRTGVLYEKSHSVVKCDYIWKRTDLWINFPWSDQDPVAKRDWSVKDA